MLADVFATAHPADESATRIRDAFGLVAEDPVDHRLGNQRNEVEQARGDDE